MLGPSMLLIGTPATLGYTAWASRRAPERVLAVLALILAGVEALGLALLLAIDLLA